MRWAWNSPTSIRGPTPRFPPPLAARGVDMSQDECDSLIAYVADLPRAPRVMAPADPKAEAQVKAGGLDFQVDRLRPIAATSPSSAILAGLYSDLLLHEMSPVLSDTGSYAVFDGRPDAPAPPPARAANPRNEPGARLYGEWRTPPLWGLRNSAPYLHDGRLRRRSIRPSLSTVARAPSRPSGTCPPLRTRATPARRVPRLSLASPEPRPAPAVPGDQGAEAGVWVGRTPTSGGAGGLPTSVPKSASTGG